MDPAIDPPVNAPTPAMEAEDYRVPLGPDDEANKAKKDIEVAVKKFFEEYDQDRLFDKNIRLQINKDRAYASGKAQNTWAVSTNVIGSMIDILVAVLYARDPDLSAKKAPMVDNSPDPLTGMPQTQSDSSREREIFARTVELVVSKLWKKASMKARMKRVVRAVLSVGHGWLKIIPLGEKKPDPLVQSAVNSLKDQIERVAMLERQIAAGETVDGNTASEDELIVQGQELQTTMEALMKTVEKMVYECLVIDFVKPEDMQVGTDVETLEEYKDSDSLVQAIYVKRSKVMAMFPDLTASDIKPAENFYRKAPHNANKGNSAAGANAATLQEAVYPTNADGEQYGTVAENENSVPFVCVLEKWDRTDNHVYTAIKGVKVWARAPYSPHWATERFFPFFYFSVYEVDGERAPQSLSDRLAKLQDEFSSVRSNFRVSRERSIPGSYFNATVMSDEDATKLKNSIREEMTAVKFTDPDQDITKVFTTRPVSNLDPRLYDTAPILVDMERMAGVQEAQSQTVSVEKTATEAEIQQAGFSTRTQSARDMLEAVLSEAAQFSAEVALQTLKFETVQKMVGTAAFWPEGIAKEDIISLVELEIVAGTTGKPRNKGDREAWAVTMPLIQAAQEKIALLQSNPQTVPLANALIELIKETMIRNGDDTDVMRFIPQPPMPAPLAPVVPPGAPGAVPGEEMVPGAPEDGAAPLAPAGPPGLEGPLEPPLTDVALESPIGA